MSQTLNRWQASTIQTLSRERRVLLLAGPRQSGKTTLVRQLDPRQTEYRTLDDGTLRELAEADPEGFVHCDKKMLIIDEIQRVPALLPAIKRVVDEDNRPGQFLLTGSANIQTLPNVRESLAGRIAKIRLRPFSQGEIACANPDFLARCFAQDFMANAKHCSRSELIETALRGGFPEALTLKPRARTRWHRDYIAAILERDLKDISRIRRHDAMRELVEVLAAWSAKFLDVAKIGAKLSTRRPTLESYINALEALFIIERVPPWTKTDYGRVGKQRKLFMADSGLMASILGLREEQVRLDPDRAGKLVETFAHNELAAQVDAGAGEYTLYHYRDREQREIDFLIERGDGALLGVEIKAAASAAQEDFKHMAWFRDNMATNRPFVGVLLYAGEHLGQFSENLWAVPIGRMWSR